MDPLNQQPVQPPIQAEPVSQSTPPVMPSTPPTSPITPSSNKGLVIGIAVVVVILIIIGIFMMTWGNSAEAPTDTTALNQNSTSSEQVQPVTNDSDDLTSIESDLEMSTEGLDEQNF